MTVEQRGESREWEEAYVLTRRSLDRRRRRLAFFDDRAFGPGPVLDLAAGDGLDMELIAERCSGPVIGSDISLRLLSRASGRRVVADAHCLPFADSSCAAVVANSVLHHLDPPLAFREIGRILRPGGRLLLMEPRPCAARSLLDWLTLSFGPSQTIPLLRARRTSLLEELDVYRRWLEAYPETPGWLAEAGLELEKEHATTFGILAQWRKAGGEGGQPRSQIS